MDIVFGQLHLLMLGTELEAVPADTVSFELCIYSYLRASCVHSDRVCRLYSFIINVLPLFECRWSPSLQTLLHVRNNLYNFSDERKFRLLHLEAAIYFPQVVVFVLVTCQCCQEMYALALVVAG